MADRGASKGASDSQQLKLAKKKAFLKEQRRLAELEWEKNQVDVSDDADSNHVPETQIEETQPIRILSQIRESPPSSSHPTPRLSQDSEGDNESASEIETPSRHVRSKKDLAAEVLVVDTLRPVSQPEEPKKEKKKAPYKMRKTLASRMGLEAKDNIGIRERRDYLRMLCARRSQPLTKPFNKFDQNVMYKLVKIVAPEMREQFGSCWTSKLTRDVIHALCLDKVRNYNARERLLAERARLAKLAEEGNDIPAESDAYDNRQVPEEDSDEEEEADSDKETVVASRKRAPGTIPKTVSINHRPSNKPNPPKHSAPKSSAAKQSVPKTSAPKQKSHQTTTHTDVFLAATPVAKGNRLPLNPTPITNESALEVISPMTIVNITRSERASSSISSAPTFREQQTTEPDDISEVLSIYIANNKPMRMPVIRGFEGFMAAISNVLTIGDSDIVYYRPADGPPKALIWRPISIEEDFSRLLDLCGDGVLVKVLPPNDDEFNSGDEGPAKVVELPVNSKTGNKKGAMTGSEVQINPLLPVDTPNGAELSTQSNSGGPEPEQGKGKRKADKKAPVPDVIVEKRPRGRPRKQKPAATDATPASNPTPTPAPTSPLATTRAGRATRMTEKASETAAIKATKKQVEQIANVRRDIRNQKANFKIQ
ncbi:uncharacterized protein H6S33_007003 [Morchella sextelata]|uniref:uncharacterized protein n=1 Tax=Morchella sextelata TaxID=1174677 RepID=UPI001D03C6F7|nr:uncharacterized protein H6S33_007003 [Morchella sextelata]KAH0603972.1 hypothetical protein H6S33_007003 [Morchella sextelata]